MKLARILHHGGPTVIKAHPGEHTGLACDRFTLRRLFRPAPDRFFTKDVFTGFGRGFDHFHMQKVGRGDVDHLYVGIGNDFVPVFRVVKKTERIDCPLRGLDFVGTDQQVGVNPRS